MMWLDAGQKLCSVCFVVHWLSLRKLIGRHKKCVWNGAQSTGDPLLLEDNDRWDERGGAAGKELEGFKHLSYLWYFSFEWRGLLSVIVSPADIIEHGSSEGTPQRSHTLHHLNSCVVFSAHEKMWCWWWWREGRREESNTTTIGPMKHIMSIHFAFATSFKTFLSLISLRHCGTSHMLIIDLSINCPHPWS